ncbi:MAG: amidohydrolase family protein [Janthinobacterium lividum]
MPIVDPHHHLWQFRPEYQVYMLDDLLADYKKGGHNIKATVFTECRTMYSVDAEEAFKPVGEVEFANGVAALSASGGLGALRLCAGIIGYADLRSPQIRKVLEAMQARAPERFRGIRQIAYFHADPAMPQAPQRVPEKLLYDSAFRRGLSHFEELGLSFDIAVNHTQLQDAIDLADAFPNVTMILNHMGGRLAHGMYADRQEEVRETWTRKIFEIAKRPNVVLKIGGIGKKNGGFNFHLRDTPPSSEQLADAWRPYFDTCIEAFGPHRAMLESNFPIDKTGCSYAVVWNTFKRLTAALSRDERTSLFSECATQTYRLPIEILDR